MTYHTPTSHPLHKPDPQRAPTCAASSDNSGTDAARGFSQIKARVDNYQRQVDAMKPQDGKPAKSGFYAKLDRLRDAKTALLHAENKLNRI